MADDNNNYLIEDMLLSMETKEIRTMNDIKNIRNNAIDTIMNDFLCYPKNTENITKIKEDLDNYELIGIPNLYKDDMILFVNTHYFYDMYLEKAKIVRKLPNNELRLRICPGNMRQTNIYKTMALKYVFRKLTDEDRVKINLVETIYSMENR